MTYDLWKRLPDGKWVRLRSDLDMGSLNDVMRVFCEDVADVDGRLPSYKPVVLGIWEHTGTLPVEDALNLWSISKLGHKTSLDPKGKRKRQAKVNESQGELFGG